MVATTLSRTLVHLVVVGGALILPAPSRASSSATPAWDERALAGSAFEFADDVETGTLLETDSPPGKWTRITNPSTDTIAARESAAHRGTWGIAVVDTDGASGKYQEGNLEYQSDAIGADLYLRAWIRVSPMSSGGQAVFFQIVSLDSLALAYAAFNAPTFELDVEGADRSGTWDSLGTSVEMPSPAWHLVELALTGIGTSSGSRTLFLDGAQIGQKTGIDWQGVQAEFIQVGEPWSDDRAFTGELDFDDIRASSAPPASRLTLSLGSPAPSESCVPVKVGLSASTGGPASAPYDVQAELRGPVLGDRVFADASCNSATAKVTIPAGASEATVYVRATGSALELVAVHPDFLQSDTLRAEPGNRSLFSAGCGQSPSRTLGPELALALVSLIGFRARKRRTTKTCR